MGSDLNEVLKDMVSVERELDYWRERCKSYERTIVHLVEAISELSNAVEKNSAK